MQALQPPTNVKRLQAHLGLFNYYKSYIVGCSRIAEPLYALTKKDAIWQWGDREQQAYDQLKAALTTPGLALKQPNPELPYYEYRYALGQVPLIPPVSEETPPTDPGTTTDEATSR